MPHVQTRPHRVEPNHTIVAGEKVGVGQNTQISGKEESVADVQSEESAESVQTIGSEDTTTHDG